jgi:hypothetical protein
MSLAKELAKLRAALDAPWPEEIWKAKAEIAERELSATKDEYCKTAFALTEQTERAEKAEAEVERLKKELADWDYGTRAEREQKRAEKAEVERLKEAKP